jgi:DNA-binding MarR family transcriptional regulator
MSVDASEVVRMPIKSPRKHVLRSPTKKGQLYGKYAAGTPIREIARKENIPPSSVHSIIKDIERKGTSRITWNTGNEHILSLSDEQRMIRHVRRSPKQTADQIADYMKVSASTIRRILKAHGYRRLRCRCKPILSPKNIKDRLDWAAANENQDWTRVIFSDEAAFELGDDQLREMCWRLPNEEYNPECLTVKKKGASSYMSGVPLSMVISSLSSVLHSGQLVRRAARRSPLRL